MHASLNNWLYTVRDLKNKQERGRPKDLQVVSTTQRKRVRFADKNTSANVHIEVNTDKLEANEVRHLTEPTDTQALDDMPPLLESSDDDDADEEACLHQQKEANHTSNSSWRENWEDDPASEPLGEITMPMLVSDSEEDDDDIDLTKTAKLQKGIESYRLWHERLGHQSKKYVEFANKEQKLGIPAGIFKLDHPCKVCDLAKQTSVHVKSGGRVHANTVGYRMSMDLLAFPVPSKTGSKHGLMGTDECAKFVLVKFLKLKSEADVMVPKIVLEFEAVSHRKVERLRVDGGGELVSKEIENWCLKHGIELEITPAGLHQYNGIAERQNRTKAEMTRSLMSKPNHPAPFWEYAVQHSVVVGNVTPNKKLKGKSPYELVSGKRFDLNLLKVFGCDCTILSDRALDKLDWRAQKGIYLGFSLQKSSHLVLNVLTRRVRYSRSVKFHETAFSKINNDPLEYDWGGIDYNLDWSRPDLVQEREDDDDAHDDAHANDAPAPDAIHEDQEEQSENRQTGLEMSMEDDELDLPLPAVPVDHGEEHEEKDNVPEHNPGLDISVDSNEVADGNEDTCSEINTTSESESENDEEEKSVQEQEVRRSGRVTRMNSNLEDYVHMAQDGFTPETYAEAMWSPYGPEWKEAVDDEIESLLERGVFTVCDLPRGKKAVKTKWVFKVKQKSNGEIDKFKARIVAKGFTQKEGIDYHETFAPVANYTTFRVLLALAARLGMKIAQRDVKTAFLYGDLEEEVYIELPAGFLACAPVLYQPLHAKLQKGLYGLKQASHIWNNTLNTKLTASGYSRSLADPCLYIKKEGNREVYVLVYVDDILVVYRNKSDLDYLDKVLQEEFEITGDDEEIYFLGMHITNKNGQVTLNQELYIKNMVSKFGMENSKPISTPVADGVHYSKEDEANTEEEKKEMEDKPYRSVVGSLIYAMIGTRPDIAYAVGLASRYLHNPGKKHWLLAKRILAYLNGTKSKKIVYTGPGQDSGPGQGRLVGYADASYADDLDKGKSTGGILVFVANGPIHWWSGRLPVVALSTAEAENMVLVRLGKEMMWLHKMLTGMKLNVSLPMRLGEDNSACIMNAKHPNSKAKTRHIRVAYHYIQELVEDKMVEVFYVPGTEMPADLLTKALGRIKFVEMSAYVLRD